MRSRGRPVARSAAGSAASSTISAGLVVIWAIVALDKGVTGKYLADVVLPVSITRPTESHAFVTTTIQGTGNVQHSFRNQQRPAGRLIFQPGRVGPGGEAGGGHRGVDRDRSR